MVDGKVEATSVAGAEVMTRPENCSMACAHGGCNNILDVDPPLLTALSNSDLSLRSVRPVRLLRDLEEVLKRLALILPS